VEDPYSTYGFNFSSSSSSFETEGELSAAVNQFLMSLNADIVSKGAELDEAVRSQKAYTIAYKLAASNQNNIDAAELLRSQAEDSFQASFTSSSMEF